MPRLLVAVALALALQANAACNVSGLGTCAQVLTSCVETTNEACACHAAYQSCAKHMGCSSLVAQDGSCVSAGCSKAQCGGTLGAKGPGCDATSYATCGAEVTKCESYMGPSGLCACLGQYDGCIAAFGCPANVVAELVKACEEAIMEIRPIPVGPGQMERFKCKLSDGTLYIQGMLTSAQNHLIHDGSLQEFCIIQVDECDCKAIVDPKSQVPRKVCILVNLQVIAPPTAHGMLGNPENADVITLPAPAVPAFVPQAAAKQEYKPAAAAAPAYSSTSGGGGYGAGGYSGMARGSGAVVATSFDEPQCLPIATLNPYSSKWTIKVRVTSKSDRRTWSNAKGDGSLFSADLLDQFGTQIRATFFREAVDKYGNRPPVVYHGNGSLYFDVIVKDGVYYMSNGKLKAANKQFSSIKNDYEISFDQYASVKAASEDAAIKRVQFDFVPISSLQASPKDAMVDVIGVLKEVGKPKPFIVLACL